MLRFTPAELEFAVTVLIGAFTAFAAMAVWLFWQQARDIADLQEAMREQEPDEEELEQPADEPATAPIPVGTDTAEADPADTFARQEHVLARAGRHRA